MRSLLAAVAFMTRVPIPLAFSREEVGRAAGWFPLVGALLGVAYSGFALLAGKHLPPPITALLLVALEALATGALHFDGLADTADGFGGGRTREDVLRIMRDHCIGSYGGTALILLVALKAAAYATLLQPGVPVAALVLAPALGRWTILPLSLFLPYARESASVAQAIGKGTALWGTAWALLLLALAHTFRALGAAAAVLVVTFLFGRYCRRKIGGFTGDTLGANVQLSELAVLLAFVWY
ncbi:MAG TPA: adenosylcobinamide-GDP ribazoletransferase [Bryobacteraceae bacterium]|nr:adenosylcobinamide-GDP ribazoletransferase [Bryobacteraceae bacterium]